MTRQQSSIPVPELLPAGPTIFQFRSIRAFPLRSEADRPSAVATATFSDRQPPESFDLPTQSDIRRSR